MTFANVIALLGGIALFLFGMTLMGDGLKKVAGNKLEMVLYRLSGTPVKGLLLGTSVTAVIQSSSATSVMAVGFVNSGMMTLVQAISVILGAIIGTSITGWIICLSSIGGTGWISILSTENLAAVIAVAGAVLRVFSKNKGRKHVGDILLGFAVLMFGMRDMGSAVTPLRDSPGFINVLTTFSNPIIGILFGALFTAILQSSSAAVGILQALSMTGLVSLSTALPVIFGIGIGGSVPVLLSAIGSKADGRRAALSYFVITVMGAIVCAGLYYGIDSAAGLNLGKNTVSVVDIAAVNTVFRVFTALVLLPLINQLASITSRLVSESSSEKAANAIFDRLDDRFLMHPSLAVEQSRLTVVSMAETAMQNFHEAVHLLFNYSDEGVRLVNEMEDTIDRYEDRIGTYLVKLNGSELNREQNDAVSMYLHVISDFERISDHATNISETAGEIKEKNISFSPEAAREISTLIAAVNEILDISFKCFIDNDIELAYSVEPLEERIDVICDEMKLRHIERLQTGKCSLNVGFVFNDILTNFERVSDHCSNIAVAMIELNKDEFETHDYIINLKELRAHDFEIRYEEYCDRYQI